MEHSDRIHRAAAKLADKFNGPSSSPIAVFITRDGAVTQTKSSTDRFEELLHSRMHKLMGVYDGACLLDWIEDDLAFMDVI